MKYYVPVGRGGRLFQLASTFTGLLGSMVYWRASRARDTRDLEGTRRDSLERDRDAQDSSERTTAS